MTTDEMLKPIEDEAGLCGLAAELGDLREGRGNASKVVDRIRDLADAMRDYRNIAGQDIDCVRLTKMLVQQ